MDCLMMMIVFQFTINITKQVFKETIFLNEGLSKKCIVILLYYF